MTAQGVKHSSLSLTNFYQIWQSEFKAIMWILWKSVSHEMVETVLVLLLKKRQRQLSIWQPLLGWSTRIYYLANLHVLCPRPATACTLSLSQWVNQKAGWDSGGLTTLWRRSSRTQKRSRSISVLSLRFCSGMGEVVRGLRHKPGLHCSFALELLVLDWLAKFFALLSNSIHPNFEKWTSYQLGNLGFSLHNNVSGSDLISVDTTYKTDKNPCRVILSAEAVKIICCPRSLWHSAPSYIQMSFLISPVLLPMKLCCTE